MILRVDGSRSYVYVKHGKVWHYIGTLDRVNLEPIITNRASPRVSTKRRSTVYNKAVIIAMLAIVIDLGNTVKPTVIGYANPDLSCEFMINNHSEVNICPLINDLD